MTRRALCLAVQVSKGASARTAFFRSLPPPYVNARVPDQSVHERLAHREAELVRQRPPQHRLARENPHARDGSMPVAIAGDLPPAPPGWQAGWPATRSFGGARKRAESSSSAARDARVDRDGSQRSAHALTEPQLLQLSTHLCASRLLTLIAHRDCCHRQTPPC